MNKNIKNSEKPIVVGIGELLWDIFPDGKQLGGAPANFAYHCHLLGANSYMISKVGSDDLGKEAVKLLEEKGIITSSIDFDEKRPTGVVSVELSEAGKPDFTIHKEVAWDYILLNDRILNISKIANAICFGTLASRCKISKKSISNIIDSVPNNCLKIFDINLRQKFYTKRLIHDLLKKANILKISDDELPIISNMFHLEKEEKETLSRLLKQFDLQLIALTKGSKGSLLISKDQEVYHSGFTTKIVDTVGAGDSFTASLTMGLLKNLDYKSIITEANRYANFICSKKGAMPEYNDYKNN